jgi:hypothetical protein
LKNLRESPGATLAVNAMLSLQVQLLDLRNVCAHVCNVNQDYRYVGIATSFFNLGVRASKIFDRIRIWRMGNSNDFCTPVGSILITIFPTIFWDALATSGLDKDFKVFCSTAVDENDLFAR